MKTKLLFGVYFLTRIYFNLLNCYTEYYKLIELIIRTFLFSTVLLLSNRIIVPYLKPKESRRQIMGIETSVT